MKKIVGIVLMCVMIMSMNTQVFGEEETDSKGLDNFQEEQEYVSDTFSDIGEDEWYSKCVKECYELGLMNGKGAGEFKASDKITLAEVITMASRVHSIYNGNGGEITKAEGAWYQGYVNYAKENKIIDEDMDFGREATREEMTYIFAKALPKEEYKKQNTVESLPDVRRGSSKSTEILMMYEAGIITGSDEQGTFKPRASISRAEASAIISRVVKVSSRKSGKEYVKTAEYDINNPIYGYHDYGIRFAEDRVQNDRQAKIIEEMKAGVSKQEQYKQVVIKAREYAKKGKVDINKMYEEYKNGKTAGEGLGIYATYLDVRAGKELTDREKIRASRYPEALFTWDKETVDYVLGGFEACGYMHKTTLIGDDAYTALIKHGGDCDASAFTVQAIFDALGGNTRVIHGEGHAWCEIEINGVWYGTDGGLYESSYTEDNPGYMAIHSVLSQSTKIQEQIKTGDTEVIKDMIENYK